MRRLIEQHPLAAVLGAAVGVRLVAVIWSQGFIHSDDYFDTVEVAYYWLTHSLWGADGFLCWKNKGAETIGRFPLYTLSLWVVMKACWAVGVESLNSMMYAIRATHALLSLVPVWVTYRVTLTVTGRVRWAVFGGLAAALHFAFPFLGVRNLIEVVGGDLWIAVIYLYYRYRDDRCTRWLWLAGIVAGLAWMVRFQIAFAVIPVPLLLWYETRSLRPALHFSAAVGVMLLLSGVSDWLLLGRFAGSTLTNLGMNAGIPALYNTIPLLYPVILFLLFIPPLSFLFFYLTLRPAFIRRHLMLFATSVFFLLCHAVQSNQQERFIFPIVPAFLLMIVLAAWEKVQAHGRLGRPRWLVNGLLALAVLVNLVMLPIMSTAYGHRGMIEPLKWFEREAPSARVAFIQPGVKRWPPVEYGGVSLECSYVRKWDDWQEPEAHGPFDYFVLYPRREGDLAALQDSVIARFGPIEPVLHVEPSLYDRVMHSLNPNHNDSFEAFVYRPEQGSH